MSTPEDEARLLNNLELLDESIDSACPGVYISGARAAANNKRLTELGIGLVVVAARSLCKQCPDPQLFLDVTNSTTEEQCSAFFHRIFEFFEKYRSALGASSAADPPPPPMRIYLGLDDNGSQNLKPVVVPFAHFLSRVLLFIGKSSSVLVHCVQGISRSVALVAGFMMFAPRPVNGGDGGNGGVDVSTPAAPAFMLHEVLDVIREARPAAQVNPCFGAQLFSMYRREMLKVTKGQTEKKHLSAEEEEPGKKVEEGGTL